MAVTYNTVIDQGADWYINFTYQQPAGTPVNLTGYTAALQLRTSPLASTTVLSLTTGAGITITGATGLIAVRATAAQTAAITNGKYSYDLEITAPSTLVVTRIVQGTIEVSAQTTRTP
jgi:hypothetical protein